MIEPVMPEPADEAGRRTSQARLLRSVCGEDEHPVSDDSAGEVQDQLLAGMIRPVDVLEHYDPAVPLALGTDDAMDSLEQPPLLALGVQLGNWSREQVPQVGEELGQRRGPHTCRL